MVVNDNAGSLAPRGVFRFIASMPQAGTRSYRKSKKPENSGFFVSGIQLFAGMTSSTRISSGAG